MPKVESFLPIDRKCKICEAPFEITPDEQQKFADRGQDIPTHCPNCLQKKHRIAYANCPDCGNQFSFTELDEVYCEKHGYNFPPKFCPDCRKLRKAKREAAGK